MSFIVKGIDLPKQGTVIHLIVQSDVEARYIALGDGELITVKNAKAIQIPKGHGRIIDEKEAIRGWCKGCAFNDGICGNDG